MPEPIVPDENLPAFEKEDLGDPTITPEGEVSIPPKLESEEELGEEPEEGAEEEPEEEKPFRVFKTEQEYLDFVESQKPKTSDKKPEDNKEEPERLFDPDFKPVDWNDFGLKLLTNPVARKILAKEMSKEVVTEIQNMSAAERAEMDKINKEFDDEYNSIAKQGLLPSLSTKEGQEINKQISLIGATYGLPSITKAYDLWKKLPKEHGGGMGYSPKKEVQRERRNKASMIGGGKGGSTTPSKPAKSYDDVHKKSLDELVQEEMK